jgi:hypothetical protein
MNMRNLRAAAGWFTWLEIAEDPREPDQENVHIHAVLDMRGLPVVAM